MKKYALFILGTGLIPLWVVAIFIIINDGPNIGVAIGWLLFLAAFWIVPSFIISIITSSIYAAGRKEKNIKSAALFFISCWFLLGIVFYKFFI